VTDRDPAAIHTNGLGFLLRDAVAEHATLADLPTPGTEGRLARAQDTGIVYRDDSTAWQVWVTPGSGGGSGFPIAFDDGTNTYEVSAGSTDVFVTNVRDGAGEDASATIRAHVTSTDGYVSLEGVSDGSAFSDLQVNGAGGIDLETVGVTGVGISMTTDEGASIVLNSVGANGNISLEAASPGGVIDLSAQAKIILGAQETLFVEANAAPTSSDLINGAFGFWFDPVTNVVSFTGRDSGGIIRTLTIGTAT